MHGFKWSTLARVVASAALLVACNRDRTNDSMAPEGMSASPRPVGIDEATTPRGAARAAETQPTTPPTPTEPAGITNSSATGGSSGAVRAGGGAAGNHQ